MENYDFILRFDNDSHSLTAKNGLSIKQTSQLLHSLHEALENNKDNKIVLSEIKGNCYALNLTTTEISIHNQLKLVHKSISENHYDNFNNKQFNYVDTIKSILKNGIYLQAYDLDKKFNVEVKKINLPKKPKYYFEITSIEGVITSIGGRSIDGLSYLRVNGFNYDIRVTSTQEKKLIPYFKKSNIRLLINKKISNFDGKVKSAELESFDIVNNISFTEGIEKVRDDDFDEKMLDIFKKRYNL